MPIILQSIPIDRPEGTNVILGQAHFIKSVEDLHEALVNAVPRIAFGLAFCEASGPCLVRTSGTDEALVESAGRNAIAIGAGHSFLILLKDCYPINVLPAIRQVPETCTVFCATANPVQVIVAETELGRAILGVVDGQGPKGIEGPEEVLKRRAFLRTIGYKF